MIPATPAELHSLMTRTLLTRIYGDVTTEARRKRLTEHDIAMIERKAISILKTSHHGFASEITAFESEPVVLQAINEIEQFLGIVRHGRLKQFVKE